MATKYRFRRPGLQDSVAFRSLDIPGGVQAEFPATAGNEIVISAVATDYLAFSATSTDTFVWS